jgi:hypothetical protein
MVIDYAESHVALVSEVLEVMLRKAREAQQVRVNAPQRLVLLVRRPKGDPGDEQALIDAVWPPMETPDQVKRLLNGALVKSLNSMPLSSDAAKDLLAAASEAYIPFVPEPSGGRLTIAEAMDWLADATRAEADGVVAGTADPLRIVIAGYLAAAGTAPTGRDGLFEAMIQHEVKYWRSTTVPKVLKELDDGEDEKENCGLPLRRAVALATLTDYSSDEPAETGAMKSLEVALDLSGDANAANRKTVVRWLHALYRERQGSRGVGADDDGAVDYWLPLEPDRLGEYLVTTCFLRPSRDKETIPHPSGDEDIVPEVLGWALDVAGRRPEMLVRPVRVLGRIAGAKAEDAQLIWDELFGDLDVFHVRQVAQWSENVGRPGAGSARALESLPEALVGVLKNNALFGLLLAAERGVQAAGPGRLTGALPGLIDAVGSVASDATLDAAIQIVGDSEPESTTGVWVCAPAMAQVLISLSRAAIARAERSADTGEAAESRLAGLLDQYAHRLWDVGDRKGAACQAFRAVKMYKGLAKANPVDYVSGFAMSLNNCARFFLEVGQHQGGVGSRPRCRGYVSNVGGGLPGRLPSCLVEQSCRLSLGGGPTPGGVGSRAPRHGVWRGVGGGQVGRQSPRLSLLVGQLRLRSLGGGSTRGGAGSRLACPGDSRDVGGGAELGCPPQPRHLVVQLRRPFAEGGPIPGGPGPGPPRPEDL